MTYWANGELAKAHDTLARLLIAWQRLADDRAALTDAMRLLTRLAQAAEASARMGSPINSLNQTTASSCWKILSTNNFKRAFPLLQTFPYNSPRV